VFCKVSKDNLRPTAVIKLLRLNSKYDPTPAAVPKLFGLNKVSKDDPRPSAVTKLLRLNKVSKDGPRPADITKLL
jgi:hypothetical protein